MARATDNLAGNVVNLAAERARRRAKIQVCGNRPIAAKTVPGRNPHAAGRPGTEPAASIDAGGEGEIGQGCNPAEVPISRFAEVAQRTHSGGRLLGDRGAGEVFAANLKPVSKSDLALAERVDFVDDLKGRLAEAGFPLVPGGPRVLVLDSDSSRRGLARQSGALPPSFDFRSGHAIPDSLSPEELHPRRRNSKPFGTEMVTDGEYGLRYQRAMLSDWLRKSLVHSGVSQSELARQMTEELRRTYARSAIHKMVAGDRRIRADELVAMTKILKSPPPGSETVPRLRTVRVAAHVEAGYFSENWEWPYDEQYDVAVPVDPVLDNFTLYAAETRGPSMNRRWPEKTVVVFTNVMETEESPIPGKRYVVERTRADGKQEHTVKLLHQDERGAFWLVPESNDPLFQEAISVESGTMDGDEVRIVGRVRYSVSIE